MIDKDEYDSFDGYVDALEARIAELEARLKAIYDAWNYEGDGPDPMYGVMNVTERKFWEGGE